MNEDKLEAEWKARRRGVIREGIGLGVATGAYGLSFGALSVAAGLSVAQACGLSLVMFTGASQFAMVGVIAAGGDPFAGAATAVLLGARNAFYGVALSSSLRPSGWRRALSAQLVIDESAAMTVGRAPRAAGVGFWAAGLSVFVFWNTATLAGALGAGLLADPCALGLDVVAPAAFLALLAPRMTSRTSLVVATAAGVIALAGVPVLPPGGPVLVVAVLTAVLGVAFARRFPIAHDIGSDLGTRGTR